MAADALVDTGAILAILQKSDKWHEACQQAFRQLRFPLLTSEAVLTELFHLVGTSRAEMETVWNFVRSGAVVVGTIEDAELPQLHSLISQRIAWQESDDFKCCLLVDPRDQHALTGVRRAARLGRRVLQCGVAPHSSIVL